MVGVTLLLIAVYIAVRAVAALIARSIPDNSKLGLAVAADSVLVLSPLAYGKGRLARRLESRALRGDSILSGGRGCCRRASPSWERRSRQ